MGIVAVVSQQEVLRWLDDIPVISDHEHHQTDEFFAGPVTLDTIFSASYVAWTGFVPKGDQETRQALLENVQYNSYFYWLERGIQRVHELDEEVSLESWETISKKIRTAYASDPDFHWRSLKEHGYERLILDTYWDPGSDNGHSEIFTPAFRIDKFMYGHHRETLAPDSFIPWNRYGFSGNTLAEYVEHMKTFIRQRHAQGLVAAFKCAEAYHRSLNFFPVGEDEAKRAFGIHPRDISPEQRQLFSNYIFHQCCELAEELGVPFQVHTGLARLNGSNPMLLEPLLAEYPNVRFVLFHSGYPWIHEVAGLAHNYANALPSLTWTATISTSSAIQALHDYIDVTPSIRSITWGSDCWVAEESVGALLAWKFIVAKVLSERINDGRLTIPRAEQLAELLLYENNRRLYFR